MTDQRPSDERDAPGLSSADWATEGGRRWLAHADRLEAMLAPVDDLLLPAADLEPGWGDVEVTPHELDLYLGGPGTTPAQAVVMGRSCGPLGSLLGDTPPEIGDAIASVLTDELTAHWDGTGVPLTAAIVIVSAHPA